MSKRRCLVQTLCPFLRPLILYVNMPVYDARPVWHQIYSCLSNQKKLSHAPWFYYFLSCRVWQLAQVVQLQIKPQLVIPLRPLSHWKVYFKSHFRKRRSRFRKRRWNFPERSTFGSSSLSKITFAKYDMFYFAKVTFESNKLSKMDRSHRKVFFRK